MADVPISAELLIRRTGAHIPGALKNDSEVAIPIFWRKIPTRDFLSFLKSLVARGLWLLDGANLAPRMDFTGDILTPARIFA